MSLYGGSRMRKEGTEPSSPPKQHIGSTELLAMGIAGMIGGGITGMSKDVIVGLKIIILGIFIVFRAATTGPTRCMFTFDEYR